MILFICISNPWLPLALQVNQNLKISLCLPHWITCNHQIISNRMYFSISLCLQYHRIHHSVCLAGTNTSPSLCCIHSEYPGINICVNKHVLPCIVFYYILLEMQGRALKKNSEKFMRIPRETISSCHSIKSSFSQRFAHQETSSPGGLIINYS